MFRLKKEFTLNVKEFFIIILLITFAVAGIFLSISITTKYLSDNSEVISSLVGASGNLLGGIIGGIVAYIVASYQVNNKLKMDDIKNSTSVSSLLRLIKAELNHNTKIVEGCKNDFADEKHMDLLNTLTTDAWLRCSDRLGEKVAIETIEGLISCTIKINAYKSYTGSISIIHSDALIDAINQAIDLIDNDIRLLSNKIQS